MLYRLDPCPGSTFLAIPASLGLTPADVAEMVAANLPPERARFILAVAQRASAQLAHVQPHGSC